MQDIILNTKGNIVIADSTQQHQADLLVMHQGHHKFTPLQGVGITDYINKEGSHSQLLQNINKNMLKDNLPTKNIRINQ